MTLREALVQYLTIRRALGTKLAEPEAARGQFVSLLEREHSSRITTALALRWAMMPQGAQRATWVRRLSLVRGLLASTGLRPGEALTLDRPDVDLENGILSIRQTKFGKSRLVPLDSSTRDALQRYAERRDALCLRPRSSAFLLTERGMRIHGEAARRTFAVISCAIGLRPPRLGRRRGRGPRLQDFRHSFATQRLVEWYRAGLDVERELPKLSSYLGHVAIGLTYWYIEAVPELLALATKRLGTVHVPGGEQ